LRSIFSEMKVSARVIATAALIQPGDEGRAYDRGMAKWQRFAAIS
jgi:hypothetical protein